MKSLVASEMIRRFSERFPDLTMVINPSVDAALFEAALERDGLMSVRLYKHDRSDDPAFRDKWVRSDTGLDLELTVKAEKGKRLWAKLALDAFKGDSESYGRMIEFQGVQFDGAKVEVEMDNGTKRTFDIKDPHHGYPLAEYIEPATDSAGEPTDDGVYEELKRVVDDLG